MFYLFFSLPFTSLESIRKVLDKQPVKFVRAIKQDTRSGKTEDRILVSDTNTLHTLHTLPHAPVRCHIRSPARDIYCSKEDAPAG